MSKQRIKSKNVIDFSSNQLMQELNSSLPVDKRLYKQDIKASIAHVEMLAAKKIIKIKDSQQICKGLIQIEKELTSDRFVFKPQLEDIHINIEQRLFEIIGKQAGMLHTARSRNDQVVTDFRLFLVEAHKSCEQQLIAVILEIGNQIEKNGQALMPGYTHLQVAQPICFGHHLLAYIEHFYRDLERLKQSCNRCNSSPLGALALAGTSYPIDREMTQKKLGFKSILINSMDAISSRDFALEFLSILSISSSAIARLTEDLILWSSQGFDFIQLPDELTSSSSIMPQKKNPDAVELIRAKTAIFQASYTQLIQIVARLPQAYFKDLQEDKKICFDSFDNYIQILKVLTLLFNKLKIKPNNMCQALENGYPAATEIADFLTKNGLPFRDAYNIVKDLVKYAQKNNLNLNQIPKSYYQNIDSKLAEVYPSLTDNQKIVDNKKSLGGAAYSEVVKRLKTIKKNLEKIRNE